MLKRILKEPLLHFLVLGGLLFFLFSLGSDDESRGDKTIVVSPDEVQRLVAQFERTWLRRPTEQEVTGLIESTVRDEVYYREALAMGLDRDDPQVRRRMRLKLEFILEDLTATAAPDDAVLVAFLQQHADRFRVPPHVGFRQVYLDPDKHRDLAAVVENILDELRAGIEPASLGDTTMLPIEYPAAYSDEIARTFGEAFAEEVVALQPGDWTGPVYSGLGAHLVLVTQHQAGYLPELAEIRAKVEREYEISRRKELKELAYQKLRQGYEVIIEPATPPDDKTSQPLAAVEPERLEQ